MTAECLVEVECEPESLGGRLDVDALMARCETMVSFKGQRPVSLLLCDDAVMRQLNRRWRQVDKATDVLSFAFDESDAPPIVHDFSEGSGAPPPSPLGEVIISLDTADKQAQEHGWSLHNELTFLFAHGLCHLLGHDHALKKEAEKMAAEESVLMGLFGLERPQGLPF